MSATPWTPGPWRASKHWRVVVADSTHGTWADDANVKSYGAPMVCESVSSEANARLIQHAPEMAEALEAIAAPDALLDATGGAFGPMAARRMQEIAKAILARIRGETP